ncbi:MAG TPA: protein kinase [Vicinamibacterales bacterium]|nr:protein kinase [Vicinamibacterales bacterium]
MTGSRLGPYEVADRLGEGGMGVVYRAVDTRLGRPVALKLLPPDAAADPERRRRFVQEARAASALNHPNIVTIYEADEHDGTAFIAMELVSGRPLDRVLADEPPPLATALELADQVAAALEAAHAAGLVHRDIKPANVIVTGDGRAKVLDFGLAKLVDRASTDETMSAIGTRAGMVMGTIAYMSPEQAQGLPVDARSDLFSLGAVLYEMLAGRRPFASDSDAGVLSAILRDPPPPLEAITRDVPAAVRALVSKALAKDPGARYQTATALRADLAAARARSTGGDAAWRRPAVFVPVAAVLLAVAAWGVWQTVEARRERWARVDAIAEIERLYHSGRTMHAVRLARDAERYAPDAIAQVRAAWQPFMLVTEPAGATIEARNYHDPEGAWEPLGTSPLQNVRLPLGYYRVRITKAGYKPLEVGAGVGRSPVVLTPETDIEPGMVFVPGGLYGFGVAPPVLLPDYWIDQLEVTNAAFKQFVDNGGYRDPKYWTMPLQMGGRALSFDDAMARFQDTTGQPGPATWELGSYPEGQADYPVGGISWFEAAAYAEFAGKELPTLYHWFRASGANEVQSDILQLSNFSGRGAAPAGEHGGVGPWGTLDMAGNVKEWAANEATGRARRYILGGGWNEPSYRFVEPDAQDPWDRAETFGVRLVRNLGPADQAAVPVGRVAPDPSSVVPVAPAQVEEYRQYYDYDRTPLDARVEATDDASSPVWTKETVSFAAAYGNERVPAYLFVPKQITPPYQTVVLFPTAYARQVPTSTALDLGTFEFLMKSGRAVLYPVYQGTFERRGNVQPGPMGLRDMFVHWAKDVFRAVDYLATRPDVDMDRLAYFSLSMGAYFGPIPVALEPRFKAAVFASGGLRYGYPAWVQPANFAPLVTIPVLLVNGRDDFGVSAAEQQRFHDLLGTPPAHKRRVVLDGGHVPQDIRELFKYTLDWLDTYLGRVR